MRINKFDVLRLMESTESGKNIVKWLSQRVKSKEEVQKHVQVSQDYNGYEARFIEREDDLIRVQELKKIREMKKQQLRELRQQLAAKEYQTNLENYQLASENDTYLIAQRGMDYLSTKCDQALQQMSELKDMAEILKNSQQIENQHDQASQLMFEEKLKIGMQQISQLLQELSQGQNTKLIQKFERANIKNILEISQLFNESKDYILKRLQQNLNQLTTETQFNTKKLFQELAQIHHQPQIKQDKLIRAEKECLLILKQKLNGYREEIQRIFTDTQGIITKIYRLKEECENQKFSPDSIPPVLKDQLAYDQEKQTLGFLQQNLNKHELTNQDLVKQLEYYRDIVNFKVSEQFIRDKEKSLEVMQKFIKGYMLISIRFKQRTDGFVLQNFSKLAENELQLIDTIAQNSIDFLQKLNSIIFDQDLQHANKFMNLTSQQQAIQDMLLDNNQATEETSKNLIRGVFDSSRLYFDNTVKQVVVVLGGLSERLERLQVNVQIFMGRESMESTKGLEIKIIKLKPWLKSFRLIIKLHYQSISKKLITSQLKSNQELIIQIKQKQSKQFKIGDSKIYDIRI
eukprot:403344897